MNTEPAIHQKKPSGGILASLMWVILIPLGIAGVVGGTMLLFWGLASVEGVASVLLLVAAILVIRLGGSNEGKLEPIALGIGIAFFALMGATVDQTGNFLYNKPLEMVFCDQGTHFVRDVIVSNPLPGTTYVQQSFDCFNSENIRVKEVSMWSILLGRFVEYVVLGYLLVIINRLVPGKRR